MVFSTSLDRLEMNIVSLIKAPDDRLLITLLGGSSASQPARSPRTTPILTDCAFDDHHQHRTQPTNQHDANEIDHPLQCRRRRRPSPCLVIGRSFQMAASSESLGWMGLTRT